MAAPVRERISVIVVDGALEALHRLGFPLSALVSMQEAGAQLTEASWTVRSTASGLSVSLFWQSSPSIGVAAARHRHNDIRVSKSKKRRLRRKKIKQAAALQSTQQSTSSTTLIVAHHQDEECHSQESLVCPGSVIDVDPSGHETCSLLDDAASRIDESLDLTLCHQSPELLLDESELSPTDISAPVFYFEKEGIPGVCFRDQGDKSFGWSPAKISRRAVKVGTGSTESSDLDIDECVSIDYQPKEGEPGFEVETKDESFWSPVAFRTRTRSKVT